MTRGGVRYQDPTNDQREVSSYTKLPGSTVCRREQARYRVFAQAGTYPYRALSAKLNWLGMLERPTGSEL